MAVRGRRFSGSDASEAGFSGGTTFTSVRKRRIGPAAIAGLVLLLVLTVIGVSVDGPRNFPKVRPMAQRLGIGYPIVLDEDGSLQQRYQARAVPTSVLISPEGRIVRVTRGWRPGETRDLESAIHALLPDSSVTSQP